MRSKRVVWTPDTVCNSRRFAYFIHLLYCYPGGGHEDLGDFEGCLVASCPVFLAVFSAESTNRSWAPTIVTHWKLLTAPAASCPPVNSPPLQPSLLVAPLLMGTSVTVPGSGEHKYLHGKAVPGVKYVGMRLSHLVKFGRWVMQKKKIKQWQQKRLAF